MKLKKKKKKNYGTRVPFKELELEFLSRTYSDVFNDVFNERHLNLNSFQGTSL